MAQIPLSNETYIDGLLWAGEPGANTVTLAKPITYSFWSDAKLDDVYKSDGFFIIDNSFSIDEKNTPWKNFEIKAMQTALKTWSNVANLKFTRVTNNNPKADFKLALVDKVEIGEETYARFAAPGRRVSGMGYFNTEIGNWNEAGLKQGGYSFLTLIHELGHGLGLKHPHNTGSDGSPLFPGVRERKSADLGEFELNQGVWTVMSYNDPPDALKIGDYGSQSTPMAFDIAAIQYLYGANMSYRTGKDIYKLPTQNQSGTSYSCIWDAGGIDTISASDASENTTINLNAAPLRGANAGGYISSVKKIYGGVTIANNVVIENAVGGSGDDKIVGNNARNSLKGSAGEDWLLGYADHDLLSGGSDNDRLTGSLGNDSLSGGSDNDRLYGGLDNDSLAGDQGEDWLSGGEGADQFIFNRLEKTIDIIANFFDSQGDQIVVSAKQFGGELKKGNLLSNQFTRGSVAVNEKTRFIYNSLSGQLFFDVDGTGEREQMQFAKLPKGASLSSSGITIVA